ncbi:MAG: oligopeptide/dipeptide ABC transporter ATP-binding protein [Eubacteriales bacterium]
MEKKLEVKNLKISFKTANGKVQAVRNINFDLYKGETLAIVGESGSGKSVTSKSILGILAGNAIIESGEIIYDGRDLLKIHEDEFYRIRGDKIAMIFQDPMSSLNPIMRIGKQLTEAMILKGKARQRASKLAFNSTLALLKGTLIKAISEGGYTALSGNYVEAITPAELEKMCKDFDTFEFKHTELQQAYNAAYQSAVEALPLVEDALFHIEKKAFSGSMYEIKEIVRLINKVSHKYVVSDKSDDIKRLAKELPSVYRDDDNAKVSDKIKYVANRVAREKSEDKVKTYENTAAKLREIKAILEEALAKDVPDFFRMGYYLKFANQPLPEMPVKELNEYLLKYLDEHFMVDFLHNIEVALRYSALVYDKEKREALDAARGAIPGFSAEGMLDKKAAYALAKSVIKEVEESIDPLEIRKDSVAYTFKTSLLHAIDNYFEAIPKNKAAQRAHDKQQAKYDKIVASGKTPEWKVIPAALIDLDDAKRDIVSVVERFIKHYEKRLADSDKRDFAKETVDLIDFFKLNASESVYKVTKSMAKHKAIKLMEEVGISEPAKRFRQYPFEFSGGMRQRMVIAVALAANPDILICDEPTTALDVTIQAQILELINKIKEERQLSIIFITHDLGVVANMADRIAVMYAGKIVECGTAEDIFYSPAHPYTWALLSSMPDLDTQDRLEAIPGTPPNMIYPPVGDAFADRNKYALDIDFEMQPPMFKISDTHEAATWLLHENAPKVDMPKTVSDRIERMKNRGGAN